MAIEGAQPLSEVMVLVAQLAEHDHVRAFEIPGCWERKLDQRWTIALNAHGTDQEYGDVTVPPFNAYLVYNGWPAGFVDPFGGVMAAGAAANEDTLIEALKVAIAS